MGGMSDVRLQLLAKELEAGQQAKVFNAPEGLEIGRASCRERVYVLV